MEEELSIKDLINALWRKKITIIIITILFFVVGIVIYGKSDTPTVTAVPEKVKEEKNSNVKMSYIKTDFMLARGIDKIEDGVTNTYKIILDSGVVTNLNTFSKSKSFLESTLQEIGSKEKIKNVQENINIYANGSSDILTLIVAQENEEDAIKISNKILENLKDKTDILYQIDELIIIDGPSEVKKDVIEELEEKIKNADVIVEEGQIAVEQEETTSPKKKIILITLVGFVLSCGIVVTVEIFSSSVKDERNLEKATNLKVLVKIPKTNFDLTDKFELLRVKLKDCKTILVTSPENNDGKSFVSLNLSKSFARFGKKVILIDTNSLVSEKNFDGNIKESKVKNLTEVSMNDKKEIIEVSDSKIEEKLRYLEENYDIVIIDSNNVLESANTLTISKFAKQTILVSSERKTKLENIVKAKNNIEDIGGNIVGNVLNNTEKK